MDKPERKHPVDISLLTKIQHYLRTYPSQFWLLFWGTLVSFIGMSMIWPFMVIYLGAELGLSLTIITTLISISAVMSLLSSFIAGSIADKIGRKWTMVVSLGVTGLSLVLMIFAHSYGQFAILMALRGAFRPLYRVGSDAMVADLVPPKKRYDAYALTRLSKNVGVAVGPAMGGLMIATSYKITFLAAAITSILFALLIALFTVETLPDAAREIQEKLITTLKTYLTIFQDRVFSSFIFGFTLRQIAGSILWVLLGAYAIDNYGLSENLYGLIPTANAVMVVLLQLYVTRRTSRYRPLAVMAIGTLFYGLGVGSIAFATGFWGFLASMMIVTIGELIVIPTASTYTANRAPETMRGRYMSMLALTMGAGSMVGPLLGGFLNDTFSPSAIWYGGGAAGFLGAMIFFILANRTRKSGGEIPAS
jgi:MFS family permease